MAALRTTQTVVRVLGPLLSPLRTTQTIVRVLGKRNPCLPSKCPPWMAEGLKRRVHRFARLFEVERKDTVTFRWTDHIGALVYSDGEAFTPIGGPNITATEHESGTREHTAEWTGALVVGGAEMDALEAGLWDDAKVTVRIVDWRYPWAGCYRHARFYTRNTSWDGERWTTQLGGISSRWQRPRGDVRARDCTHDLGDAFGDANKWGCKYDVEATEEIADVASVISAKRTFTAALTAGHIDEYFVNGKLLWDTGSNGGMVSSVRRAVEVSTGVYEIEVEMSLPQDIGVGDDFRILQGCQKRFVEDCQPKGQFNNFGGQRFMPGHDGLKINPSAVP